MPPFNAEVAIKAAEKRVDGLERKFEEFEKLTRQIDIKALGGMGTSITDLTKRVTTLETFVKALGQASAASKGAGAVMSAEAMKKAGLMTQDEINKLLKEAYDKQTAVMVKEAQVTNQKLFAQQQELTKTVVLETRLKTLEAQVAAALQKK
jgi:hypothetical protein